MKMLTIVCREKFEDEMLVLLDSQGITGFTMMKGIGGSGEAGKVSGSHGWKDRNNMFLVALDDDPMATLVEAVKALHARLVQENRRIKIPLKAFLQSCDLIV